MPGRSFLVFVLLAGLLPPMLASAETVDLSALDTAKVQGQKQRDRVGYLPRLLGQPGVGEIEPNDTPEDANGLVLDEPLTASLTAGDVDFFLVPCTGPEYVAVSTAPLEGSTTDTVLLVYDSELNLLARDDDAGLGLFSSLQHLRCEGDLFVEVVNFSSEGVGDYLITAEASTPPPPRPVNDTLAGLIELECNGAWEGTTMGSLDDLGRGLGCVVYQTVGPDVFYKVTVPYSYQLNVQVVPETPFDPAIYLFLDPGQPAASCVAAADDGFFDEAEVLSYVMEEDSLERPVTYYIAVDSWSSYSAGDFSLALGCEFIVATETATWGAVKSRF